MAKKSARWSAGFALLPILLATAGLAAAKPAPMPAAAPRNSAEAMLSWWNEAMKAGPVNKSDMRRYFTDDVEVISDEKVLAHNLNELLQGFQALQAAHRDVQTLLPLAQTFQQGDDIFVYEIAKTVGPDGRAMCSVNSGSVTLKAGRIRRMRMVRATLSPGEQIALCKDR
jgi:hypothetical protein